MDTQQWKQHVKRSHSSKNADTATLWEYLKTSSFDSIKLIRNGCEHRVHKTNYGGYWSSNDPSYIETGELLSFDWETGKACCEQVLRAWGLRRLGPDWVNALVIQMISNMDVVI